jgi:hypothetical protein
MKHAGTALTIAAIACWSASVFAQGRDFAGSWVIDSEKTAAAMSSVSGGGGGGRGGGGIGRQSAGGGGMRSGGGGVAVAGGGGGRGGGGRGGFGGAAGGRAASASPTPTVISLDATTFTVAVGEVPTVYRLDGSPTTIERPAGAVTAKASWVGDKLTIQMVTDTPNGQMSSTAVWYLEGESLVLETSAPGASGQTMARKTYFKRV